MAKTATPKTTTVPGLRVVAKAEGQRVEAAGLYFAGESVVPLGSLTEQQAAQIRAHEGLKVEDAELVVDVIETADPALT